MSAQDIALVIGVFATLVTAIAGLITALRTHSTITNSQIGQTGQMPQTAQIDPNATSTDKPGQGGAQGAK